MTGLLARRGAALAYVAARFACRAGWAAAHEAVRHREQASLATVEVEPNTATLCQVILASQATTVPFTVASYGPRSDTMDDASAPSTCVVPCLRR